MSEFWRYLSYRLGIVSVHVRFCQKAAFSTGMEHSFHVRGPQLSLLIQDYGTPVVICIASCLSGDIIVIIITNDIIVSFWRWGLCLIFLGFLHGYIEIFFLVLAFPTIKRNWKLLKILKKFYL